MRAHASEVMLKLQLEKLAGITAADEGRASCHLLQLGARESERTVSVPRATGKSTGKFGDRRGSQGSAAQVDQQLTDSSSPSPGSSPVRSASNFNCLRSNVISKKPPFTCRYTKACPCVEVRLSSALRSTRCRSSRYTKGAVLPSPSQSGVGGIASS